MQMRSLKAIKTLKRSETITKLPGQLLCTMLKCLKLWKMKNLARVHVVPNLKMTTVIPSLSSPFKRPRRVCVQFLTGTFQWLFNLLDRLPGQCTVSKLDAFVTFKQETSVRKVAAILFLTPLPCVVINLLIESIPLTDPSTGFWNSSCFQLRFFLSAFLSCLLPSLKKLDCVPESPVNTRLKLVLFALSQACIGLLTNAIISLSTDVFPTPLSQFTPILPMTIAGRLLIYRHLPADPHLHAQSNKLNIWVSVEALPVLMYPAVTIVFMALTPVQQFEVSFLLPVLKIMIRRLLWFVTKDDYDFIGVMVSCIGHLYHVLFIAMILQNAKSFETMGVVTFFTLSNLYLNYYFILNDSRELEKAKAKLEEEYQDSNDSLDLVLRIANEPRVAKALHKKNPSLLLSTYRKYHGSALLERHKELLNSATLVEEKWRKLTRNLAWKQPIHVAQMASPRSTSSPNVWQIASREVNSTVNREAFVTKFAYSLHQSQILLLKSYVTLCMSSFYVIYLVAVFWLPNRPYFATQSAMTSFKAVGSTVTRLSLICCMEIVIFGIYLVLIRKHFGVSGTYQLAFMLWSQRVLVQAQFIQLTIAVLGFPLTHFGNDLLLPLKYAKINIT